VLRKLVLSIRENAEVLLGCAGLRVVDARILAVRFFEGWRVARLACPEEGAEVHRVDGAVLVALRPDELGVSAPDPLVQF